MIAMPVEPPALALTRLPAARRAVVVELAAEIDAILGRRLVAIDGEEAAAAGFADDLALALRARGASAFRASLGDFLRPRGEAEHREALDLGTLRRVLLDPFRMGGSAGFQLAAFDAERDAPRESAWTTGPADAVLLLDGEHLDRSELRDEWTFTIDVRDPDAPRRR